MMPFGDGKFVFMRFMRLDDVADELDVKLSLVRNLVKTGELPAIQVGGRGMWRVEREDFEKYIDRQREAAREAAEQYRADHAVEENADEKQDTA